MGRKNRIFLPNQPFHIVKNSLNNINIFENTEDIEVFIKMLNEYSIKYNIKVFSYILMKDYFQFMISSQFEESISKFIQSISRQYATYFNKKYSRKGTIWEGRYKSSLVQYDLYLNKVITYINNLSIELNLNNTLSSSCKQNTKNSISKFDIDFIKSCLLKENVTGSKDFIESLETKLGQDLMPKKRGRPKSNQIRGNKMYKKLELLSKEKHKNLKIKGLENLNFAKSNSTVQLVLSEIEKVSTTFPIVFTGDENPTIVALISMGKDNLAINSEGKWITNYIPAEYRKYPFTYVSINDNQQKAVAIDVEAENLSEILGSPLFEEDGEQTQLLKDTIQFLTNYEQEAMKTRSLAKIIADANILEEREISIGEGAEKRVLVKGFKVIDREKLNSLGDNILALWVRQGIINFIEMHLKSLDNMQLLMNLSNR